MFLVTAANGNQGRLLVPKLVAAGLAVRVLVRSAVSAEHLRAVGAQDVVVGDMSDPGVLSRAMRGVRTVYHVGPVLHPQERSIGLAAVDAAREAGVEHFVFSSVLHAVTSALIQHEIKRDIEEHLLSSGLEFTILQPTIYMLPLKLRSVFEEGVFRVAWSPERLQSLVDLDDVTDVALAVMTERERHWGATYELAGPGRHSAHDLAAVMSQVLRRSIAVQEITADENLKLFLGAVDPALHPHQTRVLRALSARYSSHDFVGNPNVLTWLLGRAPTTFERFVEREHDAYSSAGSPRRLPRSDGP